MPIDKFGRHYHDATRRSGSTRYVRPYKDKRFFVTVPLLIVENIHIKGKPEIVHTVGYESGTILRIVHNIPVPGAILWVNNVQVPATDVVGTVLKKGDKLAMSTASGKDFRGMFIGELLLKCPVLSEA